MKTARDLLLAEMLGDNDSGIVSITERHSRPNCVLGDGHDGDCMDAEDIAEERLRANDYDRWSEL